MSVVNLLRWSLLNARPGVTLQATQVRALLNLIHSAAAVVADDAQSGAPTSMSVLALRERLHALGFTDADIDTLAPEAPAQPVIAGYSQN